MSRPALAESAMLISAAPGVLLWPAAMIVWGPGYVSSRHAHHCVQLVMSMQGTLRIRSKTADQWMKCRAALVRPDAMHEVEAQETLVLIAFVESESELGAALMDRIVDDITQVRPREVTRWRNSLGDPSAISASRVEPWIRDELFRGRKVPAIHPSVKRVLRILRERIAAPDAISLANLANIAGLSSSRLMHVFTESVGVPLRPYVLWLRLQLACGELVRGVSATEAAHRSGFSDAAHMTRTFRRMLGTTPRELAERRQSSQATFVHSK
jgi:AraC-like DNA-binding protein